MRKLVLLAVLCLFSIQPEARGQDRYGLHFRQAEQRKAAGDWAGMEAELKMALRYGPGDEYAWRSLAWAQARQKKWRESLANAQENYRRHGCGCSLLQVYESAVLAGDYELAAQAVAAWRKLPQQQRHISWMDADKRLRSLHATYVYEIVLENGLENEVGKSPVIMSVPGVADHQSFEYSLTTSGKVIADTKTPALNRRTLTIEHAPGEKVGIRGTLKVRSRVLGMAPLDRITSWAMPDDVSEFLGPFKNGRDMFDPKHPEIVRLAGGLKSSTPAKTVQAVLDWLSKNFRYELGKDTSLDATLKNRCGQCHHYCNLFVTLCRAAGIPSTVLHVGTLPVKLGEEAEIGSHGQVSVYLPGLGWTPVEPMNVNSLAEYGGGSILLWSTNGGVGTGIGGTGWPVRRCRLVAIEYPDGTQERFTLTGRDLEELPSAEIRLISAAVAATPEVATRVQPAGLLGQDEAKVLEHFPAAKRNAAGTYLLEQNGDRTEFLVKSGKIGALVFRGETAKQDWHLAFQKLGLPTDGVVPQRKPGGIYLEHVSGIPGGIPVIWNKAAGTLCLGTRPVLTGRPAGVQSGSLRLPPPRELVNRTTREVVQTLGSPDPDSEVELVYRFGDIEVHYIGGGLSSVKGETSVDESAKVQWINVVFKSPAVKTWQAAVRALGLDPAKASARSKKIESSIFTDYRWKTLPGWKASWIAPERKLMLAPTK